MEKPSRTERRNNSSTCFHVELAESSGSTPLILSRIREDTAHPAVIRWKHLDMIYLLNVQLVIYSQQRELSLLD
jgi:hypothetical protein